MNPLTRSYTPAHIAGWFSASTLAKSKSYQDAIAQMDVSPRSIVATVWGTARQPYVVEILFSGNGDRLQIETYCSCPVGDHCKHAAAVLVAALADRDATARPSRQVLAWVEETRTQLDKTARAAKNAKSAKPSADGLHYVLVVTPEGSTQIALIKGRLVRDKPSGQFWDNIQAALLRPPAFVVPEDLEILRLIHRLPRQSYSRAYDLHGKYAEDALEAVLESGRAWLALDAEDHAYSPQLWDFRRLARGDVRSGALVWPLDEDGRPVPGIQITPTADYALNLDPLWYLDAERGEAGRLDCGPHAALLARVLELPSLGEADIPLVTDLLVRLAPELPLPRHAQAQDLPVLAGPPQPVLRLSTFHLMHWGAHRGYPARYGYQHAPYDYAALFLRYAHDGGTVDIPAQDPRDYVTLPGGRPARIERDAALEKARWKELEAQGFAPLKPNHFPGEPVAGLLGLENEAAWDDILPRIAPALAAQGWLVEYPRDYRHHVLEAEAWEAELEEQGNGWLSLDMGLVVEGRRLPLAPLLADLFQREPRWLDASALSKIADAEHVHLFTPEQERIRVPAGRIKPLAATLIDLFDRLPSDGELRLSRLDAPRLMDLTDPSRWQFKGPDSVLRMAERLRHSQGVKPVDPPPGFTLDLRPYQREGLAWLQFLGEHELGGILADDMGLGKTAQTLAHLLLEKQSGRLGHPHPPALVVLPTSLVFNWKREVERCAPDLKVLSLHGPERQPLFAQIPEHDICLTTYPLLWRDEEELLKHEYAWLILDEAQTVKNAQAKAAAVVRKLSAQHRLCLTGTPLENHLGELWSQFDFLLPGFLGDSKHFTQTWRSPIEKRGDQLRRDLLARRIGPFILRRKKEDVAKELPDKTIILRTVELEGGQRDLYETVRVAMDMRVREEIAAKGFNRSQIVILDALLKLRQVCCDPRLLKTIKAAEKVKERAKLDLLMDMLPELVEEGRRVLVFSQFTSMLDLIAAELTKAGLGYTLLTGQTRNREQVIREFQEGDAPIFLISLKAGGVGLNLTAADTVIHYDPWWNPAAENQATDRAHRIGQTKAVFVYKLVVAGSIEERIVALQEKKAALAEGVLSEDAEALAKFGEDDLRALLAPLPTK